MRSQRCSLSSHTPGNSTTLLAATCGPMTGDAVTRYAKLREVNKGTPSCPGCTPWPRMVPCKLSSHSSGTAKPFSLFWTTTTSLLHPNGSASCMSTSKSPCGSMRASASTVPKPRPGMPQARASGRCPRAVTRFESGVGRCPCISTVLSRWARRSESHQTCCPRPAAGAHPTR